MYFCTRKHCMSCVPVISRFTGLIDQNRIFIILLWNSRSPVCFILTFGKLRCTIIIFWFVFVFWACERGTVLKMIKIYCNMKNRSRISSQQVLFGFDQWVAAKIIVANIKIIHKSTNMKFFPTKEHFFILHAILAIEINEICFDITIKVETVELSKKVAIGNKK